MKKISIILICFIAILTSCVKAEEKAAGNYDGTFTAGSNFDGTANVTATGEEITSIVLDCPSLFTSTANGVTTTIDGEIITLQFSTTSSTPGAILELNGNISNKTMNITWTISMGGSNTLSGSFTGQTS